MQQKDPTRTKLLRLEYERCLIKLFKTFINHVVPRLKPVIYQEGSKLLSQVFVGLAVRDFEDIVDEELYYYVETNLYPSVEKYMQQSYRRGINKAVKEINRGKTSTLPVVTPYLTDLDQQAINLLIDNNVALVRNVGFDTRKIITHMIVDGVLKGKSVDVISREIKKNTLRLTRNRCKMIARTEIIRSYNQAAINKYKQSGIRMYQWVTAFDERTCDLCAGLDGKTFPVDGGERPPLHINCRCTVVPVIKKS